MYNTDEANSRKGLLDFLLNYFFRKKFQVKRRKEDRFKKKKKFVKSDIKKKNAKYHKQFIM